MNVARIGVIELLRALGTIKVFGAVVAEQVHPELTPLAEGVAALIADMVKWFGPNSFAPPAFFLLQAHPLLDRLWQW